MIRLISGMVLVFMAAAQAGVPSIPASSGLVDMAAQEWPFQPGPRSVTVHLRYPEGRLDGVRPTTGLMLSLHNWGGTAFVGTADPEVLAREFDVIAIGVDYLQSGAEAALEGPPYDFGYLQALDALRAVWYVMEGLERRGIAFDSHRIYATGGSGGGNVALMANKLAPRTFACVIDLCGMKKLSDDIAFGLEGGSSLNARYSRDSNHPNFLTPDRQELHFLGRPGHLRVMRELGAQARVICVHGREDSICPFADAEEFSANARAAGLNIETCFVGPDLLDGTVFTSTGHTLGDRTRIVQQVAGRYLTPGVESALSRKGPTDFERREVIRYPTLHGTYVIDYQDGIPVGRYESAGK